MSAPAARPTGLSPSPVATLDATLTPSGHLELLSRDEVRSLDRTARGGMHELLRRCALAVLTTGSTSDDSRHVLAQHADFDIEVLTAERGIRLQLRNAPATAFVDGRIIAGIRDHLSAVLRDIVYVGNEVQRNPKYDLDTGSGITNAVFHILRNAELLEAGQTPNLVVCWGGHAIARHEYDYSKEVGHQLGLRELDVCTGCGPGAMKGPMKGATIGHAKQRRRNGRYIGISEPGIIAAEPPNPIVNRLVIMPDMEKRLEAFVRLSHGLIVFPGGVGTMEELLFLLGLRLNPANAEMPFPLVLTGPADSADYFRRLDRFIGLTLGAEAQAQYQIIVDDPAAVARAMASGVDAVRKFRIARRDAFHFNWLLQIEPEFQQPFEPTHETMAALALHRDQPLHQLAANLRRAFSGIVAGNVKDAGLRAIEAHGPFEMQGEPALMAALDELLTGFVAEQRMRLPGQSYSPCYRLSR
ncbi:MAG TPA: nucleotide 5'-monophosphate nucleosidase PpnN [Gammaproteobacteria bacterium]|nr:nucleotide 5'-monophosphate nucleosidase PpnN [Gammaproteobacteria bacterium]